MKTDCDMDDADLLSAGPLWRLVLQGEQGQAETAASRFSESLLPEALAVSIFGPGDGDTWRVDALYETKGAASAALDLLDDDDRLLASVCQVANEDWVALSHAVLAPVRAGGFVIHGQHDMDAAQADDIGILVDAGQAFGTGHHGTTRGCLEALSALAETNRFTSALDIGCGTGVLAMAAAKKLDIPVLATDFDPIAIKTARSNADINACGAIRFAVADGTDHDTIRHGGPFDLVFANILMEPLIALADNIRDVVAPGGTLVLSGLLIEQEDKVLAPYLDLGFTRAQTLHRDGWSTLVLTG